MMKVFLVIVPKGTDPEASKLKLNELRNNYIDKKQTLEQMVLESNKEGSAYKAGEILIPIAEASALNLGLSYSNLLSMYDQSEGFVSDMIETDVDFRYLCIRKKYAAKLLGISDVVQPETTITVYDYIRSNLTQQKQMQFMTTFMLIFISIASFSLPTAIALYWVVTNGFSVIQTLILKKRR